MVDDFKEEFKSACLKGGGEFNSKKSTYECSLGKNTLIFEPFSGDVILRGKGVKGLIEDVKNASSGRESVRVSNADIDRLEIRKKYGVRVI